MHEVSKLQAVAGRSTPVLKRIDDFGGGARENKKKVK